MLADVLIWGGYIALFIWLSRKGSGHDVMVSGRVGFGIQAFAYVATYISAVALVGFGGLAYAYGMQMLLVAAGNVWLGTWIVYRYLAWPTRLCQRNLQARTPVQLLANGHRSPLLGRCLALIFAVFLGVYASAVIKGAALLLAQIMPVPVWLLVWIVALLVAAAIYMGGLRGVLYTEAMQGFVMLVGICMLTVAVFDKVGGPVEGMARLAELAPTATANTGFVSLADGGQGHLPHRRGGHRRRPAGPQDLARHVVRGHRLLCAAQRRLCPDQGTDHRHALHHQLEHRGLHGTGGLRGPGALRQAQQPGRLVQLRCGLRELHALVPHDAPAIRHPAHALAFAGRAAALLRGLCFLAGRLGTRLGPGRRRPPEFLVLARGHEARDVILKTRGSGLRRLLKRAFGKKAPERI